MASNPKPQPDNDDADGEWSDLLESVEVTDIPLDMLKMLRVHLNNGNRFVFPIKEWLADGVDMKRINKAVNEWYELHGEDVAGNDFIIDLEKVKSTVSASTKKMLGLK